jgi:hypothetical protein
MSIRSQNANEVLMESANLGLSIGTSFVARILIWVFWLTSQNYQISLILALFDGLSVNDKTFPEREWGVNERPKHRTFHPYFIRLSNPCIVFLANLTKLPNFAHSSIIRRPVSWWRNVPRTRMRCQLKAKHKAFHRYFIRFSNRCNEFLVDLTKLPNFAHSSIIRRPVIWWRNGPRTRMRCQWKAQT